MRFSWAALALAGCVSASVPEHRELRPDEVESVQRAVSLMKEGGYVQEAAVVERILAKGNVRAGIMPYPETYEQVYLPFMTLEEWLFVRPDLMRGPTRRLASWLIHAARHALGDEEEQCVKAQEEFERRFR